MPDQETIHNLLALLQSIGVIACAVVGYLYRDLKHTVDLEKEKTNKAIAEVSKDFFDYKVHVAEKYATASELSKAIDNFNKRLDDTNDKLDRLIERDK